MLRAAMMRARSVVALLAVHAAAVVVAVAAAEAYPQLRGLGDRCRSGVPEHPGPRAPWAVPHPAFGWVATPGPEINPQGFRAGARRDDGGRDQSAPHRTARRGDDGARQRLLVVRIADAAALTPAWRTPWRRARRFPDVVPTSAWLDATDAFTAAERAGEPLYPPLGHLSDVGTQMLADLIAPCVMLLAPGD